MTTTRQRSVLLGLAIGLVVALAAAGWMAWSHSGDTLDARLDQPGGSPEPSDLTLTKPNGKVLPDLTLTSFAGTPTRLSSYLGKPMVVNVWSSTCAPCVKEMPAFERVHQALGSAVTFVGVDHQDELSRGKDFAGRAGVTYDLLSDPKGDLFYELGLAVMPTTLLVDRQGQVVETLFGAQDEAALTAKVRQLAGA